MRVFVTGATGLVGSNVVKVAAEKYGAEVIATIYRTKPVKSLPCITEPVDITDKQTVSQSIKKYDPDVVIHSAALVDAAFLEKNHDIGWKIFVEGTENIAKICQETKTKLIFVSTDWIFSGLNPPYKEDSVPCPVNYYGILKVVGETTVRLICEDYAIGRLAGVYGVNRGIPTQVPEKPYGFGSLPNYFLNKFQARQTISEWADYVNIKANPTLASDAADALLGIYTQNHKGIFHCCGRECITRVELAKKVAKIFGFDEGLINASFRDRTDFREWVGEDLHLPKETCLDTTGTERKLGRKNLGIEEGLIQFKDELEQNR